MIEIKPCPFCGGDSFLCGTGDGRYKIKCYKCSVEMIQDRRYKVIEYWNLRSLTPLNESMKTAEEYSTDHTGELDYVTKAAFIAGAEYMQTQKDEQIKELVDGLKYARRFMTKEQFDLEYIDELIQKYKQAR